MPPTEQELHAFLDDELTPEARVRVIEWLLENPEKSQELMELQLREDLLRNAVHYSVNGSLPGGLEKLLAQHSPTARLRRSREFYTGLGLGAIFTIIVVIVSLILF